MEKGRALLGLTAGGGPRSDEGAAGAATVDGRSRENVYISGRSTPASGAMDVFDSYRPPFDLESDMLFVNASASTRDLRRHFSSVPFLSLGGATPLVLWFSRVRSLSFGPPGGRTTLDESTAFGYNELNVVALVRGRRLFVPGIYASGELTTLLGHRYGTPKQRTEMSFLADAAMVDSAVEFASGRSEARASLLASGRILARPADWLAPWWTWPADFPDGSFIRAWVQRIPRAQLARVRGVLDLDEPWHPRPTRLSPIGLYVPGLRMRLPAPD